MNVIEIALSGALALMIYLLVRSHRKTLILRHIFMQSSDWCADKINELVDDASNAIVELETALAKEKGRIITNDRAGDAIPFIILHAKREWKAQKDEFQETLVLNGIRSLRV